MRLSLKDIGKIKNANIELDGITVIAGENNTGKSTIGKILYCIFNSFYDLEKQIYSMRRELIIAQLIISQHVREGKFSSFKGVEAVANAIFELKNEHSESDEVLKQKIIGLSYDYDVLDIGDSESEKVADKIINILYIDEHTLFMTHLSRRLSSEFNGQINNIFSDEKIGGITLKIKETEIDILIEEEVVSETSATKSLSTEVIYIDDPFILDEDKSCSIDHREHLRKKIFNSSNDFSVKETFEEIMIKQKLEDLLQKINSVCEGELINMPSRKGYGYKIKNSNAALNIKGISTGLKTFVIIKTLLLNGSLTENGIIVLDEPEIHLHPEWQLVLAEIIVLIQKEFNMHILINTHSPYFLSAIEVYSATHEIADKCRYYLAENEGENSILTDVSEGDEIDKIYAKLAGPLQELEDERYRK